LEERARVLDDEKNTSDFDLYLAMRVTVFAAIATVATAQGNGTGFSSG
jgi:hypothetical protein